MLVIKALPHDVAFLAFIPPLTLLAGSHSPRSCIVTGANTILSATEKYKINLSILRTENVENISTHTFCNEEESKGSID